VWLVGAQPLVCFPERVFDDAVLVHPLLAGFRRASDQKLVGISWGVAAADEVD
jgi:hypothetical protein